MEVFRETLIRLLLPAGKLLVALRLRPNLLSMSGILFAVVAVYFFMYDRLVTAMIFFVISGLSDAVDGIVARMRGLESAFGSFFDNFCSHYTDSVVFAGLVLAELCSPFWGLVALIGIMARLLTFRLAGLVSLEEAEALRMGFPYALAGKGDRIVLIGVGVAFDCIPEAVMVIAVLTNIVAILRTYHLYISGKAGQT